MVRRTALTAIALAAAAAGPAAAADFHVAKGGSNANACSEAAPCLTIGGTVAKAAVKDDDTIHIGPGEFVESVVTTKRLTFVGAGAGTPQAVDATKDTFVDAATVSGTGFDLTAGATLRGIRVRGGGTTDSSSPDDALRLRAVASANPIAYTLQNVIAVGGSGGTTGRAAVLVSDEGATGQAVTLAVSGDTYLSTPVSSLFSGSVAVVRGENVSATFDGTTLAPPAAGTGLYVHSKASATFTNGTVLGVFGPSFGINSASAGAHVAVSRSTIQAESFGVLASNASASVEDSLIVVKRAATAYAGDAVRASASGAGNAALVSVRNSTLVSTGPDVLSAASAFSSSSAKADVDLVNVALRATDTDAAPGDTDLLANAADGSTATVTAASSGFSDRTVVGAGTATEPGTGANVMGDPLFTGPDAGNYTPGPASPLIDRADPAFAAAGATDLAGNPRGVDGNADCTALPDIGAYEAPEMTRTDCVPLPDTTPPTLTIGGAAQRLPATGAVALKLRCPATEPDPCVGTITLRSVRKLRLPGAAPARIDLAAAPFGPLAPGSEQTLVLALDGPRQQAVRRRRAQKVRAFAALTDPAGNTAEVRKTFLLTTRPTLAVVSRKLELAKGGIVPVKVRCPRGEPGPCQGKLRLLPLGKGPALGSVRLEPLDRGRSRTLQLELTDAASERLERRGKLRARLSASLRDALGNRGTTRLVVHLRA